MHISSTSHHSLSHVISKLAINFYIFKVFKKKGFRVPLAILRTRGSTRRPGTRFCLIVPWVFPRNGLDKKLLCIVVFWGSGLVNWVGSRPFPEKPRHTIRAVCVMDCSALKLGQKNGNPGTDADLAYFWAQAVLSFPQMLSDYVGRDGIDLSDHGQSLERVRMCTTVSKRPQ